MSPRRARVLRAFAWRGLLAALLCMAASGAMPGPARAAAQEPVTPVLPTHTSPPRVALGEALFGDPRLSDSGRLSCASCHDIDRNGASSRRADTGDDGSLHRFNTPTLFNAVHSFRFNWRGDRRDLDAQIAASLRAPAFLGADPQAVAQRLREDPKLRRLAAQAYGRPLDADMLVDALAELQRSLVTPGARFDRWLQGDASALDAREIRGYHTFKRIGCVSCHQGMNLGGNLYQQSGVLQPIAQPPVGRLRVPSLRNVAVTAPYFHDGSAPTLADAVRRMGSAQLGLELPATDVEEIVAFLRTLTGHYRGRPLQDALP